MNIQYLDYINLLRLNQYKIKLQTSQSDHLIIRLNHGQQKSLSHDHQGEKPMRESRYSLSWPHVPSLDS